MPILKYDGSAAAVTAAATKNYGDMALPESLGGAAGNDQFWMSVGDTAAGGSGDDTYNVSSGNRIDELAGAGVDKVAGWQSLDLSQFQNIENVAVFQDRSFAAGNALDNVVEGGDGAQQLYGGGGQDVLIGGGGGDVFIVYKGEGNDVVQDFNTGQDVVRLKAGLFSFEAVKARMWQVGPDVRLDLGDGEGLIFRNVQVGAFSAANFQLELDYSKLGAMTFDEDFDGSLSLWDAESNPTGVWRADYGYSGAQGVGSYTLRNNGETQLYTSPYYRGHGGDFSVNPFVMGADGVLTIQARYTSNPEVTEWGYNVTSGQLNTRGGAPWMPGEGEHAPSFSQTYGYFEMRADLSEVKGTWGAFWLVASDWSWPPELDILENPVSQDTDASVAHTTVHSQASGGHTQNGQANFVPHSAEGFHKYGAMWTPENVTFYVDGVEVYRTATPADMHKPMSIIVNLATGGWGGAHGDLSGADMKIDYVRAWTLGDGAGAPSAPQLSAANPPPAVSTPPPSADTGLMIVASSDDGVQLIGGSGDDTLAASRGADTLAGGSGADAFAFNALPWSAGQVADFTPGTDIVDLRTLFAQAGYTGSDPVADGYLSLAGDGAGGTRIYLDTDGRDAVNPWPFLITTLKAVEPGAVEVGRDLLWRGASPAPALSPTPPPAAGAGQVLTSSTYGDTLTGGSGADTINAGRGPDRMMGGAGPDLFDFAALPWSAGHISDFEPGVDRIDISALYLDGYLGSDPIGDRYVSFLSDGAGGVRLMLDIDGVAGANPWPYQIAVLDNLDPRTLTLAGVFGDHAFGT